MGGDAAPAVVVDGAVRAARSFGLQLALVGAPGPIRAELARHDTHGLALSVVEAPDVVLMDEAPLTALRRKPRASVRVAADLVASGQAQALVSTGHSGATVLAAHAAIGMLPGVERPALAVVVPTAIGRTVLLDVGASVDCRPEHLVDFARLGAAYAAARYGVVRPRIGLLSIGEEAGKGTDLTRDVHARLSASALDFAGNVEPRDLFAGRADVVVCDGFTGNIVLKVGEALSEAVRDVLEEALATDRAPSPPPIARRALDWLSQVDSAEHGAAPLLGIDGLVLVGHGRSGSRAVESAVALAGELTRGDAVARLRRAIADGG